MAIRRSHIGLEEGATVAIVGGGPAGAFTALHLLEKARLRGRKLNVIIFERRLGDGDIESPVSYTGCPQCAGGVSPRLSEALEALDIQIPPEVIQLPIESINLQGRWKNLRLKVPDDRTMLSVYRGTLPRGAAHSHGAFDALLLDIAERRGARIIGSQIAGVSRDAQAKPVLTFSQSGQERSLTADFVVFATGINDSPATRAHHSAGTDLFTRLCAGYRPPKLRKALIFELEGSQIGHGLKAGELHYIESTEFELDLAMCSILPKREYLTVSLIGRSVDRAVSHQDNLDLIRQFLAIPRIRRSLPDSCSLDIGCACNPRIVVGSARHPTGHRVAAVGDMVTCRQYKDGILSAYTMARSLADTLVDEGVDARSLRRGYRPVLARFKRDNYYASYIFASYRLFFTNRFLSRVLYQTYSSEQKNKPGDRRPFERILWAISSGDDSYQRIVGWMLHPRTFWQITSTGFLVTLRASFWEAVFGLHWRGLSRHPVVVNREQQGEKLAALSNVRVRRRTYLYSIDIRQAPEQSLKVLHKFGEPDRPFLNPRMVDIRRREGTFAGGDAVVDYRIFGGLLHFSVVQVPTALPQVVQFRVEGGFADGGDFLFWIEPLPGGRSTLSVLLTFDYPRGENPLEKIFWKAFSLLFPSHIHEIIWNHALCELKQAAEQIDLDIIARVPDRLTA